MTIWATCYGRSSTPASAYSGEPASGAILSMRQMATVSSARLRV